MQHWTARIVTTAAAAGFIAAAAIVPANAADISGAGATFPYPIYAKWADAYKKETGIGLNYQSIGSGGGIKQIKAKTVTFGASDAPLSGKELDEIGLAQFPMVMGGIVPVVNLDGIKPGELTIDGPTLAKIFLGEIKTWDDPRDQEAQSERQAAAAGDRRRASLRRLRHDLQLHLLSGRRERRTGSRRSASTRRCSGRSASAPRATKASPTTSRKTKGSIGYVEYAYAKQNKLTYTKMINKAGKTVSPTSEAFQAAAANANWKSQPGYGVILANQPGDQSWPMTAATWILIYKQPSGSGRDRRGAEVLRLGLSQRRQDGREPRLRADARQRREGRRELLEGRDQGVEASASTAQSERAP